MSSYFAVVQKVYRRPSGRERDKTYVHIIQGARTFGGTFQELLLLAPWNDSTDNSYIIEITEAEFNAIQNDSFPLTWGTGNLPKWQWNLATVERGSWIDPEDDTSTWQLDVPIPDDRWIVRIYDLTPGHPQAVQLGSEDFDEDVANVTRFLKLFNPDDTPNGTNAQDQKTEIAGKQMIFDFSNGEASFEVARDRVGRISFGTDHQYRVVGPAGESSYTAFIYGRVLRAPAE